MLKFFELLVVGLLLCQPAAYCQSQSQAQSFKSPVVAKLGSLPKAISPGQKFKVNLQLDMQPGWHIYYKNPGDTGMPTQILWDLPEGFVARPLEWQKPETFVESGITTYGYKNRTTISAVIMPSKQLRATQKYRIAATVKWLACKNSCIPGSASLAVSLPVTPH